MPDPSIGDDIYIDRSPDEGFTGGLCKVMEVKAKIDDGEMITFVGVEELPEIRYNWELLEVDQERLKAKYGTERARISRNLKRWWSGGDPP